MTPPSARRIPPGPGQESVWDYPRPPRVEPTPEHVTVELGGVVVADTRNALRVLETSHPPVYYLPRRDFPDGVIEPAEGSTWCEYKGTAHYLDLVAGGRRARKAGWTYPQPSAGYEALRDHVAVYAGRVDRVLVDGEVVRPQEGDFYGGWITSRVVGPFKGPAGTHDW